MPQHFLKTHETHIRYNHIRLLSDNPKSTQKARFLGIRIFGRSPEIDAETQEMRQTPRRQTASKKRLHERSAFIEKCDKKRIFLDLSRLLRRSASPNAPSQWQNKGQ